MELIVQFKFVWGLIFTAAILLYSVVNMLLGKTSMEYVVVWQLVAVTMLLVFIHYLTFGEFILKTRSTRYKVFFHFILCYITLLVSSVMLNWVSLSRIYTLGVFTAAYIIVYLLVSMSMYLYYRITGEELNNKLAMYKQNKNNN